MKPETASVNAAQIELWNGRGGEIWTRLQAHLDRLFEPLTAALLAAAAPKRGESIVEIGCGCGDLTLLLAKACGPESQVQAIDISTRMLERAKSREKKCREAKARAAVPDMSPIQWLAADAMLYRFEPQADLVVSRFGVMFFADPAAAFGNIRRALKPGGRLALLCWAALEDNPWITVPLAAVHELIEPPPPLPLGAPGPFAFADAPRIGKILREAGFVNVTARSIETLLILGRASENDIDPVQSAVQEALLLALESGPVAALLRNADEATHLRVRDKIAAALQSCFEPMRKNVALPARCWLYQAISV
jgi:ubiquinone/menaquinone biosynthesis C-methylase UbiE